MRNCYAKDKFLFNTVLISCIHANQKYIFVLEINTFLAIYSILFGGVNQDGDSINIGNHASSEVRRLGSASTTKMAQSNYMKAVCVCAVTGLFRVQPMAWLTVQHLRQAVPDNGSMSHCVAQELLLSCVTAQQKLIVSESSL